MKAPLKQLLIVVLLAGISTSSVLAQGKIATVNLRSLFEGYYKTKLADAKIKDRAGELDKEMEDMAGRYKAAEDDYKKVTESASDLAVSKEERDRRKSEAERKLVDLKQMEQDITKFRRQAEGILREQQTRMRSRVLEEIQAEIDAKAKADGYYMVINKDADDKNETKIIMYHNGENDITDAVLGRLNASAPPGSLETKPAK